MSNTIWNKMYPPEEVQRIQDMSDKNDKFEVMFNNKRKKWNDELEPLFRTIYQGNFTMNNSKKIIDAQASVLSLRQKCNEEISKYAQKLSTEKRNTSKISQIKFLFYSTGFGLKTNLGEKKLLIEGHLRENTRLCDMIEIHVNYLRETSDNLNSWNFSIKNVLQLIEYLGK